MYGIAGERRLPEEELDWLPGYEGSSPVRIGNGAAEQFQLDVYGELADAGYLARSAAAGLGVPIDPVRDGQQRRRSHNLWDTVEELWTEPDEGIWEVRGPRRHFTHSKVMAWVAFDRAVKSVEQFGWDGPVDRWRRLRDEIHAEVCREGFDADRNTFTQYYGSRELDASVLLIPAVGFLPATDPRVLGTIDAIQRELTAGRARLPLPGRRDRRRSRRPARQGRRVPAVQLLAGRRARDERTGRARRAPCTSGCSDCATTSG